MDVINVIYHCILKDFLICHLQEYPHQLVCLEDKYRLGQCLCDWRVFDQLYNDEFSSDLLAFWRKVGYSGFSV